MRLSGDVTHAEGELPFVGCFFLGGRVKAGFLCAALDLSALPLLLMRLKACTTPHPVRGKPLDTTAQIIQAPISNSKKNLWFTTTLGWSSFFGLTLPSPSGWNSLPWKVTQGQRGKEAAASSQSQGMAEPNSRAIVVKARVLSYVPLLPIARSWALPMW